MNLFKIIYGGQEEPKPAPNEFARFDNKQAIRDRHWANFLARRDAAILRERAKQAKK
jgi:hypothetical protein